MIVIDQPFCFSPVCTYICACTPGRTGTLRGTIMLPRQSEYRERRTLMNLYGMMSWTCIPSGDWLNPVALTIGAVRSPLPNFSFDTVNGHYRYCALTVEQIVENTQKHIFRHHIAVGHNRQWNVFFCLSVTEYSCKYILDFEWILLNLCNFGKKSHLLKGMIHNYIFIIVMQ